MTADDDCTSFKGKIVCPTPDRDDVFAKGLDMSSGAIMKKEKRNLKPMDRCTRMKSGEECFTRNLFTGFVFFAIFTVVGFAWVLAHEMFHVIFFIIGGYPIYGFSFGSLFGSVMASIPTDAPQWWYFLAIGGPLLFINAMTVGITILFIPIIDRRSPYFERTVVENRTAFWSIALKAIGTFSAFVLLGNTILLPLTSIISKTISILLGTDISYSDMEIWWNATFFTPLTIERIAWQVFYVFIFALEAGLGIAFFMIVRKGGSKYTF